MNSRQVVIMQRSSTFLTMCGLSLQRHHQSQIGQLFLAFQDFVTSRQVTTCYLNSKTSRVMVASPEPNSTPKIVVLSP